jgi:hypothetical protein
MHYRNIPSALRAAAVSIAVLVAACGGSNNYGGSGDGLTQQQREDRDASASIAGLLAFALAQIATNTSETAEPRPLDGITPQVSDTDEPLVLP